MKKNRIIRTATVLLVCTLLGVAARAQDNRTSYWVGHNPKFVNITFQSEMDLEVIIGVTNMAIGEIVIDGDKGTGSVSLSIPVDPLKTGVDMRDEHLRSEMWLDAKKFPSITFKSTRIKPVEGDKSKFVVTGGFTLHGVTKEITVTVSGKEIPADAVKKAMFPEGQWRKFSTEFRVNLSDFGVKVPEMAAAKVNDTWAVKMTLYAGTAKLK